jgi:ATP-dependent Clp protease ATP-binding subunit ClpA
MERLQYLECGKIVNTHGIRGGVKLESWCDTPDDLAALKKVFRPEFLNRVDEIVVFETLKRESLLKITRLMLKEVENECTSRGIKLSVTDAAVELMTDNGYDAEYGARPLRRYIQRNIEDELAEKQLMGLLEGCKVIVVDAKDGKLDITIEK